MVWWGDILGNSFELWVKSGVKCTAKHVSYDLEFKHEGVPYVLECKCYQVVHKRGTNKLGEMSLQRPQIESLQALERKGKTVFYVGGIMLNMFDVYPIVLPLYDVVGYATKSKSKYEVAVKMTRLLTKKPLRDWIGDTFHIFPGSVHYPDFEVRE